MLWFSFDKIFTVCVDDWTVEFSIIANNVRKTPLVNSTLPCNSVDNYH